jgi:hypothetical protein
MTNPFPGFANPGTGALIPGGGLPGRQVPGFNIPGPLIPPAAPVATISTPLAPPPQMYTNVGTLINGQADIVGVMLFIRFNNVGAPALPGQGLLGQIIPGYAPVPTPPKSALLVNGVDYTHVGGRITMTEPPPVGSVLTAQVFVKGIQLGGSTAKRYVSPWALTVQGPYDGVSTAGYEIVIGPSLIGNLDGVNALLQVPVANQRYQVWRNGLLQTAMVDYVSGPTAIVFLAGAIPQPGDIVTALAYNNC